LIDPAPSLRFLRVDAAAVLSLAPERGDRRAFSVRAWDGRMQTHPLFFRDDSAFEAHSADPRPLAPQGAWERSGAAETILGERGED